MRDPGGILGQIARRKQADVAARLAGLTLADLRGPAEPSRYSLAAALSRPGARFIMEVKKASPSGGAIRAGADPAAQAKAYAGAAAAISVLTDEPFFAGSLRDLRAVRAVSDVPILAKDFIVDPRQVAEARLHGADAVLAILALLDDGEVLTVMDEAARLGMDVLVEAHDHDEIRRAVALRARIIGINNRDLRTLEVDLATTERLARLVPKDRLVVAESGIADRTDVERLAPHADAFLVGSALMRSSRPAQAARALAFGRVKVCGLTRIADVDAAARSGASFAGLVMVPNTPRAVTGGQAERIAEAVRQGGTALVGVFRNEKMIQVAHTARRLSLDVVQLHGEEDVDYIRGLRHYLPEGIEVWAAGAVGAEVPAPRPGADRTLFDTKANGRSGGTGRTFDWSRVSGRPELARSVLAGGLGLENAREAAKVGAWALDVGSGVEAEPGRKDPDKLAAFFDALRPMGRAELPPC